jgi:glycosyltransferase involved in cell wall biosynthesis
MSTTTPRPAGYGEQETHLDKRQVQISVIICTRDRPDSLRETLECLTAANCDGIQADVIVVNNAGPRAIGEIVASFRTRLSVRYLEEPTLGNYGKSHALNCALEAGGLGEIIAILDDDMSPHPNWFQAVAAICDRWPDKDIFTGNTYVIWPNASVPSWAKDPKLQSSYFSSFNLGNSDSPLGEGRWFSGNHFWFRSRVLQDRPRFKDIWNTEPDFQLDLGELGFRGIASPEAIAGHRVQPVLLERDVLLTRAKKIGSCNASVRLKPFRKVVVQARMFRQHPWLARLFCVLSYAQWYFRYLISYLYPSAADRFPHRLIALERMTGYLELLRTAKGIEDYSPWRRK